MNKAKRKAAGHACLTMFHLLNTAAHSVRTVAAVHSGGLGEGLTQRERDYLLVMASDLHGLGQKCRKLGHRFNKELA